MSKILKVSGKNIRTLDVNGEDYICITDIAKEKGDRSEQIIQNWMRNRNTLEYLSLWEELNNENFKHLESDVFKKESGLNAFLMNPKKWIEGVNSVGIIFKILKILRNVCT